MKLVTWQPGIQQVFFTQVYKAIFLLFSIWLSAEGEHIPANTQGRMDKVLYSLLSQGALVVTYRTHGRGLLRV